MSILASSTSPAPADSYSLAHRPKPRVGKLLWAAMNRVRNRYVLVATPLAGLLFFLYGHPWLGVAAASTGTATYGVLVWRDLFNPKLIRRVHGLPEIGSYLSDGERASLRHRLELDIDVEVLEPADHRELFRAIIAAHEAIRLHLMGSMAVIPGALLDTYRRCTEMTRAAVPLALRGQKLGHYLSQFDPDTLLAEVRTLNHAAEKTDDAKARATFRTAVRAKKAHLTTYFEVRGLCDQIKAQLAVIEVSLQAVGARLIKLSASDATVEQRASSLEELSELLCVDIDTLESGVEAVNDYLY